MQSASAVWSCHGSPETRQELDTDMSRLSTQDVVEDLTRLTHGRGLTVERVAGSSHLEAIPWLKEEEIRTGALWPTLLFVLLRHLILEYEGGIGPRAHAIQSAYNLHPDISTPKLEQRRINIGRLMGLSGRTIARYIGAAQPAIAASVVLKPSSDVLDGLLGEQPRTEKRRLHVRTFGATLFMNDQTLLSRIRLEYLYVSRVPKLRRTRITSIYERIDAPQVGAPVSSIEGAELLEEFTLLNGGMAHRIEFPRELNPGDEQLVIVERDLVKLGQLKRKWMLSSGTPVEKVAIRLQFDQRHLPDKLWKYEGIEHFSAPTAYTDEARLPIDRLGMAEWKTKLIDTSKVCGVAWK
jgi:hypothetical protein